MLRILSWFFGFSVFVGLIAIGVVAWYISVLTADLPDYTVLKDYQPPVTTRVHAADGTLLAEYARERRLFQPIETIPPIVVQAFLSAEDKDFYTHGGISLDGTIRALRDNILARVEGDSSIQGGGSTITQQVAKNFLLTSEQTWERKAKEALLAMRIESTFSKDRILELYLNEIFMGSFGGQTYGVAAAALNYFDKALYELKLSEVAYLAALPKGANNYHPFKHPKAAIERRNWVIDRMVENGYVTFEEGEEAKKDSLNVVPRETGTRVYAAEYFTEEVRRELAKLYGEDQLYGGGLSVRTTLDPKLQEEARKALMDGLIDYDHSKGFRGPVATIDISTGDWGVTVNEVEAACATCRNGRWPWCSKMDTNEAKIGLRPDTDVDGKLVADRVTGSLPGRVIPWVSKKLNEVLNVGDVVYVSPVADEEGVYTLEQVPEVEGRAGRHGPAHRPRAGHGRRVLLRRLRIQPRHPGAPAARFLDQADRLFGGARQWLYAGLGGARCAARNRQSRRFGLAAGKLCPGILWSADPEARHRELAKRHDGASGQGYRHAAGRRVFQAVRALRRRACRSCPWRSAPARRPISR